MLAKIFFLFLLTTSFAQAKLTHAKIDDILSEVIEKSFPNLKVERNLGLISLVAATKSNEYFFQATPIYKTIFNSAKNHQRKYAVKYNPQLLTMSEDVRPSDLAIAGIIAHELVHVVDYCENNGFENIAFGVKFITSPIKANSMRVKYERGTDIRAIALGYGPGLIEYRQWIYGMLNSQQLAKKKIIYLTPEEITAAMTKSNIE